jgi:hypothetical protein
MLALWRFRILGSWGTLWAGCVGRWWFVGSALVFSVFVVFTFGFGVEDELGVSGEGGLEFGGGVEETAADGALEAVDGVHDTAAGDLRLRDPFQ